MDGIYRRGPFELEITQLELEKKRCMNAAKVQIKASFSYNNASFLQSLPLNKIATLVNQ